ncbi:MAG: hypothetical protein AB7O98_01855 [Hyphomonadaceae bacterium]
MQRGRPRWFSFFLMAAVWVASAFWSATRNGSHPILAWWPLLGAVLYATYGVYEFVNRNRPPDERAEEPDFVQFVILAAVAFTVLASIPLGFAMFGIVSEMQR